MAITLEDKKISIAFGITLIATLCSPVVFSGWRLMFFAPFLIILYYKKSFLTCLWSSCFCGLLLDVLSAHTHLGLYAMNYTVTTGLLYNQRRHFFADSISTLPLMTLFFSLLSTMIQWGLMYAFEQRVFFSWQWVLTDLIYMPVLDALYAFICFVLPSWIFSRSPRRGKDYFSSKRSPLYRKS